MMTESIDCLFEPLEMRNLRLKNRLLMAPMATGFDLPQMVSFLSSRARGQVGLITTGEASIAPTGRTGLPNELKLEEDGDIRPLMQVTSELRRQGAASVIQLNHAGRYSPGRKIGTQPVAPSSIMSGYTGETPRALSTGEVDGLVTAFACAALRARKAGFDGVELLASSGYLISQFLSPLTNQRSDHYGGTAANRARFVLSILKQIRQQVGRDFNISVKLDAEDGMEGGISLDETKRLAPALVEAGADRLHVWAGWHESPRPMLPYYVPPAAFAHLAAEVKRSVGVPVSAVGRITDPRVAAALISRGDIDLVGIGRALLADPDFVVKARSGRANAIRPCIGCCHCFDQVVNAVRGDQGLDLTCAVNPQLGREGTELIRPTTQPKQVAVVGAGPAGLEAARVATLRGHRVTLYESTDQVGGMLQFAMLPPHKEDLKVLVQFYSGQLLSLGIETRLGTRFDAAVLQKECPDVVVLATGAKSRLLPIPGIDRSNVLTAFEALHSPGKTGHSVVVIGGGMIGLETAEQLARAGREVTIVEMGQIARDTSLTCRNGFVLRLRKSIRIMASTRVLAVEDKSIQVVDSRGQQRDINVDSVVIAGGLESNRELAHLLQTHGIEFYLAGSCRWAGLIDEAIADGFGVGCAV